LINPFLTKPNYIRIYGHRGARGDIVENSISGFKYTFDLGIKAVEFDVVISKDIYAISWSKSKLQKIKDRKPELFEKLNSLIAKNLCYKLVRSNKK